jgi:hypothetical protein
VILCETGTPLARAAASWPLFAAWLQGHELLGEAGRELRGFLDGPSGSAVAPAWGDDRWRESWLARLREDLPDEAAAARRQRAVAALAAGRAEVVVTGQQPGFLGGPLYTLHKVATAVAAAGRRSAAGQATVPLFWAGDDDDDRQEAFATVVYDPRRQVFLSGGLPQGPADRMVGAVRASEWCEGEAAWLAEQAARNGLAADLAALWKAARTEDLSWGRLHQRALLRCFADTDLLVVSGNDAGLHTLAGPLYGRLRRDPQKVIDLGGARAARFAEAGWPEPLAPASLERFLHVADGGRRLGLPPEHQEGIPARRLRPGVAARSLVQDFLFQPAGVVVGPGELAYLQQLRPLYAELGVVRSPLLPRMFCDLASTAGLGERVDGEGQGGGAGERAGRSAAATAAERVAAAASQELAHALRQVAGMEGAKAERVARGHADRWVRRTLNLIERERARQQTRRQSTLGPAWQRGPGGKEQERSLASLWAAAIWGDELTTALLAAAGHHLEEGEQGGWRRMRLIVPEPSGGDA